MTFAYVAAAFVIGAACMAYMRDRDEKRRYWQEWDRKREVERLQRD